MGHELQGAKTVQWIGASAAPLELVTHLRARGLTLTTKAAGNAMEAARLGIIEAPTNALVRPPSLRGRRIAVMLPDPGAADALAQALRGKGAEVAALSLDPDTLERVQSLDPDVVLMETTDFYGSCWEIVRAVWQHARLRYATVLLASPSPTGPDGSSTLDIPTLCVAVQTASTEYDRLREKLADASELEFGLDAFGPARTLRALLEAKRALRALFTCKDLTVEVDLVDEIIVGAHGGLGAQATETFLGPHALAELMHRHEGTVSVRAVDHPSVTNIMAPLETALHVARETLVPSRASGVRLRPVSVPAPRPANIQTPRQGFGAAAAAPPMEAAAKALGVEPPAPLPAPSSKGSTVARGAQPALTTARKTLTPSHARPAPPLAKSPTSQGGMYPPVTEGLPLTSGAKLEPPKPELSTAESEKAELPKFEPARPEPSKRGPTKLTPPKFEPAKVEPAKLEPAKPEPAKPEPAKLEPPKPEPAKPEPVKVVKVVTPKPGLAPLLRAEVQAEAAPRATAPTGSIPITEIAKDIPETSSRVSSRIDNVVTKRRGPAIPTTRIGLPQPSVVTRDTGHIVAVASLPPVAPDNDVEPETTSIAAPEASLPRAASPAVSEAPSIIPNLAPMPRIVLLDAPTEDADGQLALDTAQYSHTASKARRNLLLAVPVTLALLWLGAAAVGLPGSVSSPRPGAQAKAAELRRPSTPEPEAPLPSVPVAAPTPEHNNLDEGGEAPEESDDSRRARAKRASALVGQGHSFRKGGLLPSAKQRYLDALREWPGYPRALAGLAQLALLNGDEAQAVSYARQLVKVRPGQLEYQVLLGDAYKSAGLLSQARETWQLAAKRGSRTARQRLSN